jgi:hypothetical protein
MATGRRTDQEGGCTSITALLASHTIHRELHLNNDMGLLEVAIMANPLATDHQIGRTEPRQAMKPTLTGMRRSQLQFTKRRPAATGLRHITHVETHLKCIAT